LKSVDSTSQKHRAADFLEYPGKRLLLTPESKKSSSYQRNRLRRARENLAPRRRGVKLIRRRLLAHC
jgi:hypothetical protein